MINIIVFLLAFAGLAVAWFIYYKRSKKENLVCVVGKKCDVVLYSKYNNIANVPLENLGMLYYVTVAILTILFLRGQETILAIPIISTIITISVIGALFSIYLLYVQGVILKAWCDYCITSAIISIAILVVELV